MKNLLGFGAVMAGLILIFVIGFASEPVAVPPGYQALADQIKSAMTDNLKSETIRKGADLQFMAKTYYGDSLGWPLVWFFNTDTVPNPELVEAGTKLKIPRLKAGISTEESTKALENAYILVYYLYANDGKHSKAQRQWVLGQARSAGLDLKGQAWAGILTSDDVAWVNGQKLSTVAKTAVVPKAVVLDTKQTKAVIALAAKADEKALEDLILKAQTNNALDDLQGDLETEAAKPEADSKPEIHFALALTYGRKGLKTQEYAALVKAEEAAKKLGVNFNISIIYGRKQLLENDVEADKFLVGDLLVESNPIGAEVSLDGKLVGKTPLSLKAIKFGGHTVKLDLLDYESFEAPVVVELGSLKKESKNLTFKYGFLSFEVPSNYSVLSIDGEEAEYSEPIRLATGEHKVILADPNFEPFSEKISIGSNEQKKYLPSLKPKTFTWSFVSNAKDAQVSLDGVILTKDEILKKQVVAGKHKVKYEATNYEVAEFDRDFFVSNFDDLKNLYVYRDLEMVPWLVPTVSNIIVDGKDDDWKSVPEVSIVDFPKKDDLSTSGNFVKSIKLCQDKDSVYFYLSFSDGNPTNYLDQKEPKMVILTSLESVFKPKQGGNAYDNLVNRTLYFESSNANMYKGLKGNSSIPAEADILFRGQRNQSYFIGTDFIEARFPLNEMTSLMDDIVKLNCSFGSNLSKGGVLLNKVTIKKIRWK